MAGLIGDNEEQRVIDRIRANAYREAMEEGATFINRKWIAQKLHRSERWVTDNCKKRIRTLFYRIWKWKTRKVIRRRQKNCDGKQWEKTKKL